MEHNKKIEYTYKTYLKYSNDIFIYNNISVLCIISTPSTNKLNQITNVFDLSDKKEQYKND